MRKLKEILATLMRPSAKLSIVVLAGGGVLAGVVGILAFDASLHMTNTEEFCLSCHEMSSIPM